MTTFRIKLLATGVAIAIATTLAATTTANAMARGARWHAWQAPRAPIGGNFVTNFPGGAAAWTKLHTVAPKRPSH